jgi:hypothetical protein
VVPTILYPTHQAYPAIDISGGKLAAMVGPLPARQVSEEIRCCDFRHKVVSLYDFRVQNSRFTVNGLKITIKLIYGKPEISSSNHTDGQ